MSYHARCNDSFFWPSHPPGKFGVTAAWAAAFGLAAFEVPACCPGESVELTPLPRPTPTSCEAVRKVSFLAGGSYSAC